MNAAFITFGIVWLASARNASCVGRARINRNPRVTLESPQSRPALRGMVSPRICRCVAAADHVNRSAVSVLSRNGTLLVVAVLSAICERACRKVALEDSTDSRTDTVHSSAALAFSENLVLSESFSVSTYYRVFRIEPEKSAGSSSRFK